jgi:hypothetical protein
MHPWGPIFFPLRAEGEGTDFGVPIFFPMRFGTCTPSFQNAPNGTLLYPKSFTQSWTFIVFKGGPNGSISIPLFLGVPNVS